MTDAKKVQNLIDAEYKRIALRDQFAAAALPACMAQIWKVCMETNTKVGNVYGAAAAAAYEAADAMMTERRKTMFEAAEEQNPTTAVSPQGVSVYEALRQLVGYVEDMSGHAEVARMTQPDTWAEQPDHPMTLARAALEAGRSKSVHHAGDADGWIKHDSDVCPVLWCTAVDVKFRSGSVSLNRRADALVWVRSKEPAGIVAYRVVRR